MVRLPVAFCMLLAVPTSWGLAQDQVSYRLGLGGTYTAWPLVDVPPFGQFPQHTQGTQYKYVHGSESANQVFNPALTPQIRWDAIVEVEGPNYGAANLVVNLAVRAGAPGGPLATAAMFSGDFPGDAAGNFSVGLTTQPNPADPESVYYASIVDPVGFGGPNMSQYDDGAAYPGELQGMGAGYVGWNGFNSVRPGVGRLTLPNGNPGLGHHPTFDGKIDISGLSPGLYYLVLTQGTGVNVLRDDVNLSQSQGSFAKAADLRLGTEIPFYVVPEPAALGGLLLAGLGLLRSRRRI